MIGTPEYISPEQVEGKEADRRSDIYSLGIILYEMVAGRLPFDADTPLSIAVKHKTETPPDPAKFNPQIPDELSRVILQCIQKEKKKRYQETDELLRELQRIEEGLSSTERIIPKRKTTALKEKGAAFWRGWKIAAALFVFVTVVGITILSINKEAPAPPSNKKMLVVLPFDNLGPPEDEYFADGLTEELTTRLAALHGLGVISRTSSKQYKSTTKTVKQIGKELGVDYLLEGTVRWDRNQSGKGVVRVMPQLIRVSDDTRLWYERYDRVIEDIFEVQSEIAEQVINQLDLTLLEPEREALMAHPTNNLEAYDFYLRGRKHAGLGWYNSDPKEFDKAVELLEKAVELDPHFTFAYITLSVTNQWIYTNGFDRTEKRLVKAREAVYRALELEPDLPEAKLTLGLFYYRGYQDYDRALEIFKSVQKARPNLPYTYLGYIQRRMGRWEESTANLEKSFKLNPRSSDLAYQIGTSYMYMRKYQEAEEWCDRALSIDPNYYFPQLAKAEIAYLSRGDIDEARALLRKLPQHRLTDYRWYTLEMLAGDYQQVLRRLGSSSYDSFVASSIYIPVDLAYASAYFAIKEVSLMKNHAESVRLVLEKAMVERPTDPRFHAATGLAYAYLGRKEEAIREGNRAVQICPVSRDALDGPQYIWNLAIIYTVIGEYEEAIGQLEYLLSIHAGHLISVPLLRIDTMWEPLRKHPRFQRLIQKNK
jgi:serine/threonine-protein kinase